MKKELQDGVVEGKCRCSEKEEDVSTEGGRRKPEQETVREGAPQLP